MAAPVVQRTVGGWQVEVTEAGRLVGDALRGPGLSPAGVSKVVGIMSRYLKPDVAARVAGRLPVLAPAPRLLVERNSFSVDVLVEDGAKLADRLAEVLETPGCLAV